MYGIIYSITNRTDGKVYIGKTTKTLLERKKGHLKDSKRKSYHLYCAMRRDGVDSFEWSTLCECLSKENLDEKEKEYIQTYRSYDPKFGYNSTLGGEGLSNPTEETKARMSEAHKGKAPSNKGTTVDMKEYPYYGMTGKTHSLRSRQKMAEAKLGKKLAESHRINSANAHKKEVRCIELDKLFPSINEAGVYMGAKNGKGLLNCLIGRIKNNTYKGLHWEYALKEGQHAIQ